MNYEKKKPVGTLPESPPDSGSEPPYSPDLHGLNQIQYHQQHYPHQLDAALHLNEPQNEMHQNVMPKLPLSGRILLINFLVFFIDANDARAGPTSFDGNESE